MTGAARSLLVLAVLATTLGGCATSGPSGTSRAQRNVITVEELAQAGDVSVYEALQKLRPQFLRGRVPVGTTSEIIPVAVYIGDLKMEGVEHLREVMVRAVREVRYLEPQQANARYGGNNASGALIVTLM